MSSNEMMFFFWGGGLFLVLRSMLQTRVFFVVAKLQWFHYSFESFKCLKLFFFDYVGRLEMGLANYRNEVAPCVVQANFETLTMTSGRFSIGNNS